MKTDKEIQLIKEWWASRRMKYNSGLIIAGIISFSIYAFIGITLIAPNDPDFEITLFTIFFQGFGYLIMMGIANLFYNLGAYLDINYNNDNRQEFRERLYKIGFWGSFILPFAIPVLVLVQYLAFS